jgi:hypothetical protein
MLTVLLLLGCTDGGTHADSGSEPIDGCVSTGSPSVEIGVLNGDVFNPLTVGQEVLLVAAPQGGQGISVAARSFGLGAGGPSEFIVDVLLEPYWNGEVQGSFVSEGLTLYCYDNESDDGTHGRVWGTVVGFDEDIYASDDDLAVLDGETVDLLVGVTDAQGNYVEGHVDVIISF